MQSGRKIASSIKGQIRDSLRNWWEPYTKPDLYKFLGGVLWGLVGFSTNLEEEPPTERFTWRGTIGELLSGGEFRELSPIFFLATVSLPFPCSF